MKSTRSEADWGDDEWEDDEGPDGDDDFDYDEFVENEFGNANQKSQHLTWVRLVAFALLLIFVILTFTQLGF